MGFGELFNAYQRLLTFSSAVKHLSLALELHKYDHDYNKLAPHPQAWLGCSPLRPTIVFKCP